MNRRNLIKIVMGLLILYVVIWLGVVLSSDTKRNDWLFDNETYPTTAPLSVVGQDDWIAILADPNFTAKSLNERITIANQHFEKKKALAAEHAYDLKALQKWYQQTAADAEHYPIQTFVFGETVQTRYRDLRNSGFPKPSPWRAFWRVFISEQAMVYAIFALIISPFATILILLLIGSGVVIFSRTLSFKWRILVAGLVTVMLLEGWVINFITNSHQKHPVSLPTYLFWDGKWFVGAHGTWASSVKLSAPVQTTTLDCQQHLNSCVEATAKVVDGLLFVSIDHWRVKNWGVDEITFHDKDSLCRVDTLHIDRKGEIVTATNTPKRPIPDSCRGLGDEPIVVHLADGFKHQYD